MTMTIAQVNEVLVEAVRGVPSNKLSPRRAVALVQLCTALQRTLPAADLEARLTRLEDQVVERITAAPCAAEGPTREQKGSGLLTGPKARRMTSRSS